MTAITARIEKYFGFQQPLVWRNIIGIFILNLVSLYALFVIVPFQAKVITFIFGWLYGNIGGGIGVSIGAHRLWTHKTFKATLPLRIFIMFWYMSAGQYSLVQWVRDHRTHHKFTDTDADPHNAKRGFFFSHCGWLMMKRHPDVKEKGKLIDLSDLWQDPVVRFSQKYFVPLLILCHSVIPACFAYYVFEEPWSVCIIEVIMLRYTIGLHVEWTINSVAHLWGYKPYNKNIMAVQNNFAAFCTFGEAWHNFHHTFPWDYRIGEYGHRYKWGCYVIDLFSWLGLAYDLKTASPEMVKRVLAKQGDLAVNEEIPYPEINHDEINPDVVERKSKDV